MKTSKILPYLITVLLLFTSVNYAQIITSKKEAVKKGIYKKPFENNKTEWSANNDKEVKTTKPAAGKSKNVVINENEDRDLILSPAENYLASQMINNAMQFVGVKYRGGGTSRSGMDCSGMVTAVFNIFDLKLPRSSHEMAKVGEKRADNDIQKGDLIFFKTNGRGVINHVGMVIDVINDEIKFIHSSTSRGVMISSTKESYYKKSYAQVNKVL